MSYHDILINELELELDIPFKKSYLKVYGLVFGRN
jgi:hypothetical protein